MAESIDREIKIDVNAGDFSSVLQDIKQQGASSYEELKKAAQGYSDILYEQGRKLDDLIRKRNEYFNSLREEKRLQVELEFEGMVEGAGEKEMKDARSWKESP